MREEAEQHVIDHLLMREVFHCTPSELGEQDDEKIRLHWAIRELLRKEEGKRVK